MAEINLDWRLVKEQDRLPTRTREWWTQQHVSWAHNRNSEPRQTRQYGGSALFSIDKAAHRVIGKGCDESNLGRWCWSRYQGKGNQTLRIITAYRPNPPQGPYTVYAQQNAFFHTIGRDICPRQAFLADLTEDITKFMEEGDHIILTIDGNSDMKKSDLSTALNKLSLKEAILHRHGNRGPATHKRNSTGIPIDGIWISPGLEIIKGGYFAYDEVVMSDHRCLWIDLTFVAAFGHNMAPLCRRTPRRLHCKDPRLVQNYIKLYHQMAKPIDLFHRVQEFEKRAPYMSRFEVIQEYEALDSIRCKVTAAAERRCRKLRTGQVAFSPELNESRLKIRAWLLLISKKKQNKVSSRLIKRALKKANISNEMRGLQLEELQEELKEEYKRYYKIKSEASQLRLTALESLAEALAEEGKVDKEKTLKALREREQQRTTARKIRFLQGKIRTGSTTLVSITDADGQKRDITEKVAIERAILDSNKKKFSQSVHTPFYQTPLKETFGFKGLTTAAQATLATIRFCTL